jgi:hypothetical protein
VPEFFLGVKRPRLEVPRLRVSGAIPLHLRAVKRQNYIVAWTVHFQIMIKEGPTKCIFKVNHMFRISILLLHVSALQERHLQGTQRFLMKLCVCYVISSE